MAIFVCSDTLIFFKTINPSLYFAVLCQLLLLSLVVFLSRLKGLGSRNVILYICVFLSTVSIRFIIVGVGYPDAYLYIYRILVIYIVYLIFRLSKVNLVSVLNIGLVINAMPALIPSIAERVSSNVNYSNNLDMLGEVGVRYTGFFPSPGYLMFFLACYFGVVFLAQKFNYFMAIVALVEGYLTFNRSVLVLLVFVLLYLLLYQKGKFLVLFVLFVALTPLWIPFIEDYVNNAILRFAADSLLESERLYGSTGFISALDGTQDRWLLGNPVSYDGGLPKFAANGTLFNVHFGIVKFMLIHGLVFLIPVLFFLYRILIRNTSFLVLLSASLMLIFVLIEPLFDTILFWIVPLYSAHRIRNKTSVLVAT